MISLKPEHKPVRQYYAELEQFTRLGIKHEMAVRTAFQHVLEHCCHQVKLTLEPEYKIKTVGKRSISVDGALVDNIRLPQGYWEAKDSQDDLAREVQKKLALGYPRDNIIFQAPMKAILWQGGIQIYDEDITKPETLVAVVRELFTYKSDVQVDWEQAIEQFKPRIPDVAKEAVKLIERERKENPQFVSAFGSFMDTCRASINPNLSDAAIEEMLVQHLLTERIFRKVFHNSDFTDRNIIAHEIEQVIRSLTARKFSKEEFLKPLDHFYGALERRAETLYDYAQQQSFVNTVYEKFFQGFAVKQADTLGIIYTPQCIVNFMVRSVEEILKQEFGKSLSSDGVHIIDPFVGTGNFIARIMREIKATALPRKYAGELHCNDVMLLPYYIASMNIEHEYYERTGEYKPFEGICLVDTFELAESKQPFMFTEENTERVEKLKKTRLFVVIANPPYNAWQLNENDNNKNRQYPVMDGRVGETYSKDSIATNKMSLSDPYVKAIRWASDKVLENGEGIVAFVSNNSFIEKFAFDGMRKHISQDFTKIYVLDLKGNARTSGERRRKEKGNIFEDKVRVGISINFFIRKKDAQPTTEINLFTVEDYMTSLEKKKYLEVFPSWSAIKWEKVEPDRKYNWRKEGLQSDFDEHVPMGTKLAKAGTGQAIFKLFSPGIKTNRDTWVYNFDQEKLERNVRRSIDTYNEQVLKWQALPDKPKSKEMLREFLGLFLLKDETKIDWSRDLKTDLVRGRTTNFDENKKRKTLYRPFTYTYLYFDSIMNQDVHRFPLILPNSYCSDDNRILIVPSAGSSQIAFLIAKDLIDVNFFGGAAPIQCFPFYVYDENGLNRRENITDWAVEQFTLAVKASVDKWQIFHYVYGSLYSPEYREKYAANLKRELPRIPLPKDLEDFRFYSEAGQQLAELHVNYEAQPEYPLDEIETPGKQLNWLVEKMRLTGDKTAIVYNDFLTLAGIPPETFEYKLGNRSALEWIIDRYRVHTDKRSGIVNDPNRSDDPQYIVRLIKKIVTVSLETVKTVEGL